MDTIVINGIEKRIIYRHERLTKVRPNKTALVSPTGGVTHCSVNLGTKEQPDIFLAVSRCHSKDIYNKELGRRISYGRLVSHMRDNGFTVN